MFWLNDRRRAVVGRPAAPGWPPHIHCGRYVEHFHLAFGLAALPAVAAGTALFGVGALRVCSLSIASAVGGAVFCQAATQWHSAGPACRAHWLHAALIGLLLGLTLPPTVPWQVPVLGGFVAVCIGKELLGGLGNCLWHPALVGRAVVALLFAAQVAPASLPFLARGHLVTGSTSVAAETGGVYYGFARSEPPQGVEAWAMQRPVDLLARRCHGPQAGAETSQPSLLEFFRDRLPPWRDTVWGHVGGGIGETCLPALVLGGLWLIYRGYVRWQLPAAALATVAVLAAVWPIQVVAGGQVEPTQPATRWLPLLLTAEGLPVGTAIVLFHLTGGGLWLACLLIATDPVSSPLTSRGQALFGVGLGALIMVARCNPWYPALPGAEYWAVLGMNTLVPLIDRVSARRALGTRARVHYHTSTFVDTEQPTC